MRRAQTGADERKRRVRNPRSLDARRAGDRHGASIEAYLAEQLHNIIDDTTVTPLSGDKDFLIAFHYPAEP